MNEDKLMLSAEEQAGITEDVVELCREYWSTIGSKPVWREQDRAVLQEVTRRGIPEQAPAWESTLTILRSTLGSQAHLAHPRFFAFVPSPNNFVSCLGDLLASVHNPFASTWLEGSGAQTIERVVATWLAGELGLPKCSGGLFSSGGSLSNLTALVAARNWRFGFGEWHRGSVYFSDQTHQSIQKALRILGFSEREVRVLPTDNMFRMQPATLEACIDRDVASSHVPFCVVANAGTTNTGAIDPLADISGICKRRQMWLHVDGAYGAATALCDEGKENLRGLSLADSISIDPHKWLFQPYDCGCLLVRDASHLHAAFHAGAEYLQDTESEWNLCDYGPELTRRLRALKLWLSLQVFGASSFRSAISRGLHLARFAERKLQELAPEWKIVTPASLGIVTFRYAPDGATEAEIAELNSSIAKSCLHDGFAFVATTQLKGKTALRFCTINPRTTEDDIAQTAIRLHQLASTAAC